MTIATIALIGTAELWAVMSIAWLIERRTGNAGWIDVAWSLGTGLAGVTFACLSVDGAPPPGLRQIAVATLVAVWSLRLALHIARRSAAGIDDPRYAALRVEWGAAFPLRLYLFLMVQAAVALGLAATIGLAAWNPAAPGAMDLAATLVLAAGILGEGIADGQLRRFKADPANRGKVCDVGLWSWSRHPNYFCEWLCWVAYPLFALSGLWPWGALALSGPLLMYWALRHASGVPPLEEHMRRRYGEAFAAYAARVSVFFPLPPRSDSLP